MTKRPRAGLPGAPTRLPKVPLRFRALGGVDPRSLPPGTPYPCNDPAVGASVRGKQFAGKILGCATPPPGKRGRHFVVGGLESRSAISSAKRASERTREVLRARYEGPDFDARPKRRGSTRAAPVAGPRPSTAPARGFLYGIYRMDLDSNRVRPDGSFSPSFRRGDALAMEYAPSAAAAFEAWWSQETALGNKRPSERSNYWAWAVESDRNKGDWKAENARLRLSRLSATYAPPTLDEDVARRRQRAKARGLAVFQPAKASTVKRREELPLPKPMFMRRTREMDGPAWSPPAPKARKGAAAKPRKAAPAESKITSMPTDDAARIEEAASVLEGVFTNVARQTFAPGVMQLPATRSAPAGALSVSEAVVAPAGKGHKAKVYAVRLHERPGVYAFVIRVDNPGMLVGVGGGDPPTQLVGASWKTNLKRAIAKE